MALLRIFPRLLSFSSPALLRAEAPATAGDAVDQKIAALRLLVDRTRLLGAKVTTVGRDLTKFSAFDARCKQRRG